MRRLSRRNTLIALGSLAGGMGVIVGSGAFTSTEAQRDVQIQTSGDASALLQLTPAGTGTIVQEDGDGLLYFGVDSSGNGINRQARTTFRPAFEVTNNGGNDVTFYVEESGTDIASGGVLDFQNNADQSSLVGTGTSAGVQITPGGSQLVDLVIDLINYDYTTLEAISNVMLIAESTA